MQFLTYSGAKEESKIAIFFIIRSLIETYQQFKCYICYKSLENAVLFLEKINYPSKYNFKIDELKCECTKLIKITSLNTFD